jgi:hypothetical protein
MGGKKTPKAPKPKTATSAFAGVTNSNVNLGGLFSGSANKTGDALNVTTGLGAGLQPIQASALSGIGSSQNELNISNADQLGRIDQGLNTTYNLLDEVNRRNTEKTLASAQSRYSLNGLENSTVRGAGEMQLANDAMLRDLVARQQAIEGNRNAAYQTLTAQQGILNGLISGQQYAGNLADQNLITGLNDQSAVSQFNAGQANQMANSNYQAAVQQSMQPSVWGQLGQSALGMAGTALGGAFGGPIGASIGSALAGLGGGGGNPMAGMSIMPGQFVSNAMGGSW